MTDGYSKGAQSAQMGRHLLAHNKLFYQSIRDCQRALESLPDGPSWSLMHEMSLGEAESRVSQAMISQPLCTAIQIALLDLLRASGVKFAAVVGHSSGEIGAAYAAGLLSLRDAMGIAYYRGYVAQLASGPGGKKGSMMAAAMSLRDATALCSEPRFAGRVGVAASNAPSSVTLSGDLDAVTEVKEVLEEKKIQARQLRVDTAYHSHHMHRCADKYLAHLKQMKIRIRKPAEADRCVWLSSVRPDTAILSGLLDSELTGQYWVDNMVNAVLFSEAVSYAVKSSTAKLSFAFEVGPHPALKGPVGQTLKPLLESPMPYVGCLERGKNGVETMSAALGLLWSHIGSSAMDFTSWRESFALPGQAPMLQGLPSYAWDHDQIYWQESRISHNYRLGDQVPHNLLGRLRESSQHEQTWRNIFHLNEIPWVRGHTFQGQILFPGAGYLSLAVEAAKKFVQDRPIKMVEIRDMNIPKALVIGENSGVEILFTIRTRSPPTGLEDASVLYAEFVSYSSADERVLEKTCDGQLIIHLGKAEPGDLPPSQISQSELTPLAEDRFHKAVYELGLGYEGVFRTLHSINRTWGHAKASASWTKGDLNQDYTLHPAVLDVTFQAGLATFVSTAEKSMPSPYLPIGIRRVVIDPNQNYQDSFGETSIEIEALMANSSTSAVEVDLVVCPKPGNGEVTCGIQVDGLILKAIAEPQPSEDRQLFVKTIWDVDAAYGLPEPPTAQINKKESIQMIDAVERTALFFLRKFTLEVSSEELAAGSWHHKELFRAVSTVVDQTLEGRHPVLRKEWLNDDLNTIREISERYPGNVDIAMLTAVGENLLSVVRGESGMMEHMMNDDLLGRLYREGSGLVACNQYVADFMRKISHKFPRTKILEVGAGTGGTTLSILEAIGTSYSSYTCTDLSASFFDKLAEKLPEVHGQRVDYKVFNAEKSPAAQGFVEGSYDIVIAANVLHATRKLSETVQNARALLRPGGYLIAIEVTGKMLRETGFMGGLEGWWLGVGEGRSLGPGIDAKEWDDLLRLNGFSGIDSIMHDQPDVSRHSCSVFVSQALDDKVETLRDPLFSLDSIPESPILIVGGKTLPISKLARRAEKLLRRWTGSITTCESVDDLDSTKMLPGTTVLYLAELEKAFFSEPPTQSRLEGLQEMLSTARNILWVTSGRLLEDPYSNMMVGVGRALSVELPHVTMHFLDFDEPASWDIEIIIQQLLRLVMLSSSPQALEDALWVTEQEVVVKGGQILAPRIVQDHQANETLNAGRRQISKLVDPAEDIEIAYDENAAAPARLVKSSKSPVALEDQTDVCVNLSVAIHSGQEKSRFLCFGHLSNTNDAVLALSETDSSFLQTPANALFKLGDSESCNADTLVHIASSLIASYVLPTILAHGTTLVLGASPRIAEAISRAAEQQSCNVVFVEVGKMAQTQRQGWITLHPQAASRVISRLIPRDVVTLLCLSNEGTETVLPHLPKHCAIQNFDTSIIPANCAEAVAAIGDAFTSFKAAPSACMEEMLPVDVVNIKDAPEKILARRSRLSAVLDWTRHEQVNCIVPPLNASNIFSPSKTYFLVGMAGELGQSLCRFMVRGGARYIVLASRNPTKDPHWLADLRSTGADVRVVKMDVTIRSQVRETVAMLRQTMPIIGGVANAALVFDAGIFVNFDAANIIGQLKPKVDGTVHLDEEFATDNLDFFLTFGSLATVCGNPGQAMYHAGNMFMASLVEKRRRRGQVAAILNFGLLTDVGYVARMDRSEGTTNIEGRLRDLLLTPLAEAEFHHLVLQAILSGQPGTHSGEVIMGMQPYIDDGNTTARPPWVDKPFFSHMIHTPEVTEGRVSAESSATSMQQLRDELSMAANVVEATEAVKQLLAKKIELMIKVPSASIDTNAPLSDLGLDSLNGIDIRKWLLTELKINVPLLSILGRQSMMTLCADIAKKYMEANAHQTSSEPIATEAAKPQATEPPAVPLKAALELKTTFETPKPELAAQEAPVDESDTDASSSSVNTPTVSNDGNLHSSGFLQRGLSSEASTPNSKHQSPEMSYILPDSNESDAVVEHKRSEKVSSAQAGIHFLHTFLEDKTSFNVTTRYTVNGPLNVNRLSRAIEKTLARHDAYQTCFFADEGSQRLKQHVVKNPRLNRFTHLTSQPGMAEEDAQRAFESIVNHEWMLASGQTFHAIVITHEPEVHTLVFGFHLIISDALSVSIFLRDVDRAYQMLPLNSTSSFLDFSRQQLEDVSSGSLEDSIAYWKQQLDPLPSLLPLLPFAKAKSRQVRRAYGNHIIEKELSSDMARKIRKASQACGGTSMQFYLAVMQVLLARLADVDDVCIGVTDSGRGRTGEFADSVGHFANILPMRLKVDVEKTFAELVSTTSQTVLGAFDNAQVPFDMLLERLGIERSPKHTPLFQAAFNYRLGDILQRPLGNCSLKMENYSDVKTPYDLTINVTQTASQGHLVEVISNDMLYSSAATESILDIYIGLIEVLSVSQSVKVKNCNPQNSANVEEAITIGRGLTVQHTWPQTLVERFQEVISLYPHSVAIKDAEASMTYHQLAQRVSEYASALLDAEAEAGCRIAVLCEPSIDTYAVMLATLFIGAVYVPLDLSLPISRRKVMIDVCQPDLIVFHNATVTAVADTCADLSGHGNLRKLNLSYIRGPVSENVVPFPTRLVKESFLLFTSGSTGTPKGIKLGQKGIMNYAASKSAMLGLGQVKVLQQTNTGFDMAIAQAFNAFANGGTLVVAPSKARGDPSMIAQLILDEAIDFTLATPSEYLMYATYAGDILRQSNSWKHACSGGESVTGKLIAALQKLGLPNLTLTDCYGPTEVSCATTFSNIHLGEGDDKNNQENMASSVGKAISNTSIYIMSDDGTTALPAGIPGEICVGGSGVALGYLDAKLSSQKFVRNPFASAEDQTKGWNVMYKTGDKGLLQPDGSLVFLGRTNGGDTLVKLRGLRIDLDEVANAILAAVPGNTIADAVVTVRGEPEYLIAHVVFAGAEVLDQVQLDSILQRLTLPRYMIPAIILPLDRLPTTPNGKVDRRAVQALPLPERSQKSDIQRALTVPEGELRIIWEEVLGEASGVADIGPDSDFFTVGGSSLLLVRLQNLLRERTGVMLSLQELYQAPTLKMMAAAMSNERGLVSGEQIDWDAETSIAADMWAATQLPAASPTPLRRKRQVLLAGATSFLGGEILRQLMVDEEVGKIHCIAIPEDEYNKLPSDGHGKMVVYSGSLLSSTLGLSKKEVAFLQSNVDQIIHAAVQGHCMNNYTSVKQALYLSTRFLASMAIPRRVPFHLISAPRVVLLSGNFEAEPASLASSPPPTDGTQGVTASKWASEVFLQRLSQESGLPVVIHRHCALIGERAPADDVMNSVVRFSVLSGKVPNVSGAQGFFDFRDVVEVASAIANQAIPAEGQVVYRHHSSDVRVPFSQFALRMKELYYGRDFEVVSPVEWLDSAKAFGMGEMLMIHLKANMESGKPMIFPYLGR